LKAILPNKNLAAIQNLNGTIGYNYLNIFKIKRRKANRSHRTLQSCALSPKFWKYIKRIRAN